MFKLFIWLTITSVPYKSMIGSYQILNFGVVEVTGANTSSNRIVKGYEVRPGSRPWMVSMFNESWEFCCGASILNEEFLLTAAHCKLPILNIVAGDHDRSFIVGNEQVRSVVKQFLHPSHMMGNDIAILQLDAPLKFNERISAICLPEGGEGLESGTLATISGWGAEADVDFAGSDILLETQVPVAEMQLCESYYGKQAHRLICAGFEKPGNQDTCFGDSGGPLALQKNGKWIQYGITSYGFGIYCGGGCGHFTFYTKTSSYINWITQTISGNGTFSRNVC